MKSKKTICLIGPDETYKGGILEVMHQIENYFADSNEYEVVHVSTATKKNNKLKVFLCGLFRYMMLSLKKKELIAHIQLSEGGSIPRTIVIILISKILRNKVVLHSHGGMFYTQFYKSDKKIQKIIKYIFSLSNRIIVLTKGSSKIWENIVPKTKIHIIPNGIKIKNVICKKYFANNRLNLIFLGNISDFKGVYDLIDAIELLSKKNIAIHLKIAGGGEIDRCRQYILDKGLLSNIDVLGWVEGDEKKKLLLESDILMLPSYFESFGIAAIEGMSYKLPVICGDAGFTKEIIIEGKNGLIAKTGDIFSLAKKIEYLNSETLVKSMGENAYIHVKKNYEIEYVMQQIKCIYQDC